MLTLNCSHSFRKSCFIQSPFLLATYSLRWSHHSLCIHDSYNQHLQNLQYSVSLLLCFIKCDMVYTCNNLQYFLDKSTIGSVAQALLALVWSCFPWCRSFKSFLDVMPANQTKCCNVKPWPSSFRPRCRFCLVKLYLVQMQQRSKWPTSVFVKVEKQMKALQEWSIPHIH